MKTHLLLIDMQNDFCGSGQNGCHAGSLYVPGADQDAERLAKFINKNGKQINSMHATLDSHRSVQVFHPIFWCDSKGTHPDPFTIISVEDVENGTWVTTNPAWRQRGVEYVRALAARGRFPLCIWPYHTLISSVGHALVPSVSDALIKWEQGYFAMVDYCVKGDYYLSEHYGALEAEVPSPEEPSTQLNTGLVGILQEADVLLIAGEALSHCVKNTVEQVATAFGDENIKKIVLLTDCSSNVPGFENLGTDFVRDMTARGMQISTSVDYFA